MPKGVRKERRDDTDFTEYADGGPVGLYANINAKRKRIAAGSKEKMRKPGSKGAPTAQAFINSAKTAKKGPLQEPQPSTWSSPSSLKRRGRELAERCVQVMTYAQLAVLLT
jgi:hypothetical protein